MLELLERTKLSLLLAEMGIIANIWLYRVCLGQTSKSNRSALLQILKK